MNKFLTVIFAAILLSSAALADEKTITLDGLGLSQFCKDYIREHMRSLDVHGDMVEECTNLEKGLTRWGDKIVKRKKPRFTLETPRAHPQKHHPLLGYSEQSCQKRDVWYAIDG